MKTETNLDLTAKTELVQLTDNEIDAVGGGIILGGPGPCHFYAPYPIPRTNPWAYKLGQVPPSRF